MRYQLGEKVKLFGTVTSLDMVRPGAERSTESILGYHFGRLDAGYQIAFPLRLPRPEEFQFDGTTMRSGGRVGLPLADAAADEARPRVHDQIMTERQESGYKSLQESALKDTPLRGARRLCKVLPALPHSPSMPPSQQYPMGEGAKQWYFVEDRSEVFFLIAVEVTAGGLAWTLNPDHTPGPEIDLKRGGYDAIARLRRHMEAV